ncbi:TRAP transporter small permease [Alkalihalobacillus oceani]|uniref:TRAP transporter small permease n=1 Tax=Halalkalibacter oceani TaxID=1653776 RepID=UPI00203CA92C|nr:TRAP transporter small permease [Halalkalibacter oceani]MCM3762251.1 TRAP transporter small permease [Halalkalibacter oceani]
MSKQQSSLQIEQMENEEGLQSKEKNKRLIALEKVENTLVATMLFLILIVVIAQVYARFVTGNSITWAGELSRFLAVWLIFLGSAIALRRNLHIQVDNLYNNVSEKLGLVLYVLRGLIILAFLAVIFVGSLEMLEIVSMQTSPGLGIRMNFVYIVMPVSICLMVVVVLVQLFVRSRKKRG